MRLTWARALLLIGAILAATEASTAPAGAGIVKIAGRYTWPQNWLDTPTASQMGIKKFGESPDLAALVKAGKLPPIEQRLPEEPLVIAPYEETGRFGGTVRVAWTGPSDYGDMYRGMHSFLFNSDPTTNKILPYLAKGYVLSADNKQLTIYLRKGVKWSDGVPFTTQDIMWMYTNVWADPDVPKSAPQAGTWTFGGKLAKFEAVDDFTLKITFPQQLPPSQMTQLLNWGKARHGLMFTAAHYMKQFHKKFNPDVEKLAKEQGYSTWQALLLAHVNTDPNQPFTQPELGPWIMESRDAQGKHMVRNPYFWAVDPQGNQLPYVDRVEVVFFSDPQVALLGMMQGNIDIGGRLLNPKEFALYKQNEKLGNYRVLEWVDVKTAWPLYDINLTPEDPIKRIVFQDKRFRHALSLAINRGDINDFVFQGLGNPQQFTVDAGAPFYDPDWARAYAEYDPKQAKALLDEVGLRDVNGDGTREGPDGKPFVVEMLVRTNSVLGPLAFDVSELVRGYWEQVGIKVNYKQIAEELAAQLQAANKMDLIVSVAVQYLPSRLLPVPTFDSENCVYALKWHYWLVHKRWEAAGRIGNEPQAGEEPPAEWKKFMDNLEAWVLAPTTAESNRLGKEVWSQYAELLPAIGAVGLAVRPIIINNRIHNVPETLPFAFETVLWCQAMPAQWFIR